VRRVIPPDATGGRPPRSPRAATSRGRSDVAVGLCEAPAVRRADRTNLNNAALAFRAVHTLIAVVELACLAQVWRSAITRRRGVAFRVATTVLLAEGVGLVIGRGNCPLGPLQGRLGDPVPLFELVLPPRAAKAAVPALAAVAVGGIGLAIARRPVDN
jgi:hypothetical protein